MNEQIWHDIFENYIEDFNGLCKLQAHGIIDEDKANEIRYSLLSDIIETFRSEVEE